WSDWPSFRELDNLHRQMDALFSGFRAPVGSRIGTAGGYDVPCDVDETEDHFLFTMDIPGLKREDIQIDLSDNVLTVAGEKKYETDRKEDGQRFVERRYGNFQRRFQLPASVKADAIEAAYEDGVLRIAVPKSEESKPRRIQ